ncbi:hypothetical protein MQQ_02562 [Staphylococcus aureus subsp. aureus VRS9]|nr:hypothetical protein MQQ_02562 [Staphylococcus aureus subsp. aureus VRS9]
MTKKYLNTQNEISAFWNTQKIFKKSIDNRKGQESFVFYDGPPTANGLPHAGHVLGRVIKDLVARLKTMQGFYVGVPSGKCGFTTLRKFIKETNSSALKLIIGLSLLL